MEWSSGLKEQSRRHQALTDSLPWSQSRCYVDSGEHAADRGETASRRACHLAEFGVAHA